MFQQYLFQRGKQNPKATENVHLQIHFPSSSPTQYKAASFIAATLKLKSNNKNHGGEVRPDATYSAATGQALGFPVTGVLAREDIVPR